MNEVIMYTVDYCSYCKKAEMFFKERNIPFKKIDITSDEKEYRKKLGEYYDIQGKVTVPQIIIDGQRIGGYDDLLEFVSHSNFNQLFKDLSITKRGSKTSSFCFLKCISIIWICI